MFIWDSTSQLLEHLWTEILGTQVPMTTRVSVAAFYVARVKDRSGALTSLFEAGRYVPAVPLVRAAYEDWLSCAFLLCRPQDEADPATELLDQLGAEHARFVRRFQALCGKRAARIQFPQHPEYAESYLKQRTDPPHVPRDWAGKASALGLETVHGVVYNYLSDLSHGSFYAASQYIGVDGARYFEKPLKRDVEDEELLASWAYWAHLRTLTVAGREWHRDYEEMSDHWIGELKAQRKDKTIATCISRKETWRGTV